MALSVLCSSRWMDALYIVRYFRHCCRFSQSSYVVATAYFLLRFNIPVLTPSVWELSVVLC